MKVPRWLTRLVPVILLFPPSGLGTLNVAGGCESPDERPPILTQPSVPFAIRDTRGKTAMTFHCDPRGIGHLTTSDASDYDWVLATSDSAWHYREWQWWDGHPHGDSCRPRYWANVRFRVEAVYQPEPSIVAGNNPRALQAECGSSIEYRVDGFTSIQQVLPPHQVDADLPYFDIVFTMRNTTGHAVRDYAQFFACYTAANADPDDVGRRRSHWFWDRSGALVRWSDKGVTHLNGYVVHPDAYFHDQGRIPHCPRGNGRIVGTFQYPVLVSNASPAGHRSIILVDPQHAAGLSQGMEGPAMDYILFPGADNVEFGPSEQFTAHIRHYVVRSADLPSIGQLKNLWKAFTGAKPSVVSRARALRKSAPW